MNTLNLCLICVYVKNNLLAVICQDNFLARSGYLLKSLQVNCSFPSYVPVCNTHARKIGLNN